MSLERVTPTPDSMIYCSPQQRIINTNLKKNFSRTVNSDTLQRMNRMKDKHAQDIWTILQWGNWSQKEVINPQSFRSDILRQVNEQEVKSEHFAEGFAGKIYLVELALGEKIKKLTVIKKSKKYWEKIDNTSILHEYNYHSQAHAFFANSNIYGIDTPEIYWTVNWLNWEILLVMEYIEGLTIFSYKNISTLLYIVDLLKNHQIEWYSDLIIQIELILSQNPHDMDIKKLMITVCDAFSKDENPIIRNFFDKYISSSWVPYTTARDRIQWVFFEKYLVNIFDKLSKDVWLWIFDDTTKQSIKDRLQNAILWLNTVLYHNDVNTRNVILWEDGKIYLIDYDKADIKPSALLTKTYKESRRMSYEKHNGRENIYDLDILNHFSLL